VLNSRLCVQVLGDQETAKLVELSPAQACWWWYGETMVAGGGPGQLMSYWPRAACGRLSDPVQAAEWDLDKLKDGKSN